MYGYPPPHVASYEKGIAKLETVEQGLLERDILLVMLKTNLEVAHNRMNVQANKHRTENEFVVGDCVSQVNPLSIAVPSFSCLS